MSDEPQLIDRIELAKLIGLKPGTFWKYVLQYNVRAKDKGWPLLEPDKILPEYGKFLFNPSRVDEFKAALEKRKERNEHESHQS